MIKKCPHCGGEGFLGWNYSYKSRSWFVFVRCDICGAQGKTYTSKEEPEDETSTAAQSAIVAWNMRYKEEVDT